MATITQTESGKWKAIIRKTGWPTSVKTFRLKRDAEDWARRTEDEMVRGVYIQRAPSERTTLSDALDRYVREVTPSKAASTQTSEKRRAKTLKLHLGRYSLAALTPQLVPSTATSAYPAKLQRPRMSAARDRVQETLLASNLPSWVTCTRSPHESGDSG